MNVHERKMRARRRFHGLMVSDPDQEDQQYDNDGARFEDAVDSLYSGGNEEED